jgi:hypothetical protein
MRTSIVILAAASLFTAASAATVTAQVTGIRHSDGSWTFVDANGRDIHKDQSAGRQPRHGAAARRGAARHNREDRRVTGYLPWLSR